MRSVWPSLFIALLAYPFISLFYKIGMTFVNQNEQWGYFLSNGFFTIIFNSILLASTVSIVATLLGVVSVILYFSLSATTRFVWLALQMLVFFISPLIIVATLSRCSLFNVLSSYLASSLVLSLNLFPLVFVITLLGVSSIGRSSINSARMLLPPHVVIQKIIFAQIKPSIVFAAGIIFILVLGVEDVPSFLGYRTYAEEFFSRIVVMESIDEAIIASTPYMLLGLMAAALLYKLQKKETLLFGGYTQVDMSLFSFNKKIQYLLTLAATGVIGLLVLLLREINWQDISSLLSDNIPVIGISLLLATTAAFAAVVLSKALVSLFKGYQTLSAVLVLLALLYWMLPASLSTLILIEASLMTHSTLLQLIWMIVGFMSKLLPLGILVLLVFQASHTDVQRKAEHLFHIVWWRRLWKITFLGQWQQWLFILLLLTSYALNEITVTVLLIPPGIETSVVKIFNLMHYGDFSTVAFLSLVQGLLTLTSITFALLMLQRKRV